MLDGRGSSKVQAYHLVPEVAAPKESMTNLELFITESDTSDVVITIDSDAKMVNEAESEAAVRPGLGSVSEATLLGAKQQKGLHGWNRDSTLA